MRYCILFFTLVVSGCLPHYEPPLTLGTNLWIGYEPLYLARELDYYRNQNIRLVELGSTSQALDALRVGKLDMAAVTLDEAILLTQENLPIKVIWVMNISAGADALVVKPQIKQASDLRGKRIGVEQTAVGAYLLSSFLARTGLELAEIKIVSLPLDEHLPAWKSQKVDALITFDPVLQAVLKQNGRVLFDSRAMPGEVVDVLVARKEALACCSERIEHLIKGQQKALVYLATHPQAAQELMAKRSQSTRADIAAALTGLELPNQQQNHQLLHALQHNDAPLTQSAQRLAQIMYRSGLIPQSVDVSKLVDDRFAHKEL